MNLVGSKKIAHSAAQHTAQPAKQQAINQAAPAE